MPKMKTHKGSAKRFKMTGTGKIMRAQGRRGHFRRRKATRLLQQLDRTKPVHKTNRRSVVVALPYGSPR
ncbi:MAG: 50S ribosomal protein L35 [Chloroflexi bacterium AL-W]|nr:50S ribosomal protein L35 [Chloroflexi bacterium AL-N1]NOK68617.1 50S ribosomal protein L35 [Chloroflexi bacterium AL-N10]NOK76103.1 50S ribosomal protein L35 [Chloroflexi bacterium AL-N5]NOK82576.1 50S ribosomal protein L35 [Chloroflexi bacterium AL-W]NOK93374.1 50S ribosomal protein L35 [Chloroflexi bacterium AL-N15]